MAVTCLHWSGAAEKNKTCGYSVLEDSRYGGECFPKTAGDGTQPGGSQDKDTAPGRRS